MRKSIPRFCWECGEHLAREDAVEENIEGTIVYLHEDCKDYRNSVVYKDDWEEDISCEIIDWR